jgi:hypothetical protein
MDERKKRKREVRKEDREENLGNRSLQNVGIYQRMYRVSHSTFISTLKSAKKTPTAWIRVLLKHLILPQLVKKYPAFYGTRSSLPCSKQLTISFYPESH